MTHVLLQRLEQSFISLHRQYRLGNFEGHVFVRRWWADERDESEFYEVVEECQSSDSGSTAIVEVSFTEAINDLYRLTTYLEQRADLVATNALMLLRCKCLVYEATDYLLNVPPALGAYFIEWANRFTDTPREVEKIAEDLNPSRYRTKDERANVIKLILIATICGANQLYRQHNANSYDRALRVLEKVNRFIEKELPSQHEENRQSFGISGLAQYVNGRVLSRKGFVQESRHAFRASAEAYVARIRQKEDFLRDGRIAPQEYEEKISVTIRRAALVEAFGDGYHYFVSGQLTRALESLTLARAALTRNSGRVYLTYVDMLYWACHRAARSSDKATIENCVRELRDCRKRFQQLIPASPYFHRAGMQLALALLYRRQLTGDLGQRDYREGLGYLEDAIEYASRPTDERDFLNPSLLAGALINKSRYLSSRYVPNRKLGRANRNFEFLEEARRAAQYAHEVSKGINMMQSEASATLGDIFIDLAELGLADGRETFGAYFDAALTSLRRALAENGGKNVRNEAVCFLRLTRLCLLNPNTHVAAHGYFERWKTIADVVEHDYCKTMAADLERKLGPRIFIVSAAESLEPDYWETRVFDFLLKEALKEFVAIHLGKTYNSRVLKGFLTRHLRGRLGYASSTVSDLIEAENLISIVQDMMKQKPTELVFKRKRASYLKRKNGPKDERMPGDSH